jgi:hypothetical protein
MLRSGFGGGSAKSISSTSAGKQNIADRGKGANSVVRSISGADLASWLDASYLFDADAATIQTWTAREGTSPAATAAGKRPAMDIDGYSSRPAIKFDSTRKDFLFWAAEGLTSADTPANTIISVNTTANDGASAILFEMGADYSAAQSLAQYYNGVNKFVTGMGTNAGGGTDKDEGTSTSCCPSIDNVCISTFDRSVTYGLATYVNSEPATVTGKESGTSGTNTAWSSLISYLGARNSSHGSPSLPFNGAIREFIVLNRALTKGEAFRIGRALMNKSGVTKMYVA